MIHDFDDAPETEPEAAESHLTDHETVEQEFTNPELGEPFDDVVPLEEFVDAIQGGRSTRCDEGEGEDEDFDDYDETESRPIDEDRVTELEKEIAEIDAESASIGPRLEVLKPLIDRLSADITILQNQKEDPNTRGSIRLIEEDIQAAFAKRRPFKSEFAELSAKLPRMATRKREIEAEIKKLRYIL